MADKLFTDPSATGTQLKAITINGAIQVESAEDIQKRNERRAKRKSRWDASQGQGASKASKVSANALVPLGGATGGPFSSGVKDNAALWAARSQMGGQLLQPTMDVLKMDDTAQKIYLLKMQIQEACLKLGQPTLGIPPNPRDRSPSPEPIYNNKGVRINTRMDRTRNKLVTMRNQAITRLKELDPTYQPPSVFNYKNAELEDRVNIPAEEYPHINFVGLLLGPRGQQLEDIKAKTNTIISIRGKGCLRAGMTGIKDGRKLEALDEPLHAYITGQTAENVKKAAKIIQELIDMEIYNPDCEKAVALKAKHMYNLAVINGTLRDIDMKCLNCGKMGHQTWQCTESSSFTSAVICSSCGGVGHLTKDCRQKRPGEVFNKVKSKADPKVIDAEYEAFLNDMDGKAGGGRKNAKAAAAAKPDDGKLPSMQGGIGTGSGLFASPSVPLMLTNGSAAPGAASAAVRTHSNPTQMAGGAFISTGTSIFGGKMTRMTSGYKSASEIEMEKEKKKQEFANRPVPIEWKVEAYEKKVHKQQDEYFKSLEREAKRAKEAKLAQQEAEKNKTNHLSSLLSMAPPPPPPGAAPTGDFDLPDLKANPWESLKKL